MEKKSFPIKIGLEIHGYLNTKEKLFCKCKVSEEEKPNAFICPICTGQPGSKPMAPNEEAVNKIIQIALILDSKVNEKWIWQRKHYNWADLPKGYQNTISGPHSTPCAIGGKFAGINITEAHLEEDPAQWNPQTGKINYNRSGLPLVEIVTEPEFSSSEQVTSWLKSLILFLSYIKAIRKNAGIKVDVNVSTYGDRVEMKNLNSLEKIGKAIEYEIAKQIENHNKGIEQKRETLAFDEKLGKTIKMREKEGAQDYRFIPDPDLPSVKIDEGRINNIKKNLPEMPDKKLKKLISELKIPEKDAKILIKNLELVEFVEELEKEKINVKENLSWITIELLRILNYNKKTLEDEDVEINPKHLAELIKLVNSKKITVLKAKQIMNDFIPKSFSIKEKGDVDKINNEAIENICKQVIEENKHVVEEYQSGKGVSLNFLIGQVMKLSQRRADFKIAKEKLVKLIKGQ
ncbi:MAG: Asp-tRNA(Asn)/Glu-tRNA(Gln) amidotransferase subunit GatB [Candidatus Pacearchaeota archaeon]